MSADTDQIARENFGNHPAAREALRIQKEHGLATDDRTSAAGQAIAFMLSWAIRETTPSLLRTVQPQPGVVEDPTGEPAAQEASHRTPLKLIFDGEDNIAAPSWIVRGLLPDGLSMLYGPPGSGKSFLALSWALHIAAGKPWLGRRTKAGTVVYIYSEGAGALAIRKAAAKAAAGIEGALPFVAIPGTVPIGKDVPLSALDEIAGQIKAAVEARGLPPVRLVVADTVARTLQGDENGTADMAAFVRALDHLRDQLATGERPSALAVHHTGWDKTRERGSSALRGAVDAAMALQGSEMVDGLKALTLTCEKQKDGEPFTPLALGLRRVVVMKDGRPLLDDEGQDVTTCTVEPGEAARAVEDAVDRLAPVKGEMLKAAAERPGLSKREILEAVQTRIGKESKLAALDSLLREGRLESRRREARGGGFALFLAGPRTWSDQVQTRLDQGEGTWSSRSLPTDHVPGPTSFGDGGEVPPGDPTDGWEDAA